MATPAQIPFGAVLNSFGPSVGDIAWNGTRWVAAAYPGTGTTTSIAYSSNGLTWTPVSSSATTVLSVGRAVAWNGYTWLAGGISVSGNACLATSLDGINWTPVTPSVSPVMADIRTIVWNGSLWVAGGVNNNPNDPTIMWTSAVDGKTGWTNTTSPFDSRCRNIAWNGNMFVAVGGSINAGGGIVATSLDGNTWTTRLTTPTFAGGDAAAWNGSVWEIGGGGGQYAWSTDGINWTITSGSSPADIRSRRVLPYLPAPSNVPTIPKILTAPTTLTNIPNSVVVGGTSTIYTIPSTHYPETNAVYDSTVSVTMTLNSSSYVPSNTKYGTIFTFRYNSAYSQQTVYTDTTGVSSGNQSAKLQLRFKQNGTNSLLLQVTNNTNSGVLQTSAQYQITSFSCNNIANAMLDMGSTV